jgi:predicted lipid-binding transport protein (Tim44 family)
MTRTGCAARWPLPLVLAAALASAAPAQPLPEPPPDAATEEEPAPARRGGSAEIAGGVVVGLVAGFFLLILIGATGALSD